MVKYRPHILFFVLMFLYIVTRYLRSSLSNLPDFIRFHLTDLLFIPAMACFALIFVRIIKRNPNILLPFHLVLVQTTFVSIFFEWYLPKYGMNGNQYTYDPIDVLMYFSGAVLFLGLQSLLLKTRDHPTNQQR